MAVDEHHGRLRVEKIGRKPHARVELLEMLPQRTGLGLPVAPNPRSEPYCEPCPSRSGDGEVSVIGEAGRLHPADDIRRDRSGTTDLV